MFDFGVKPVDLGRHKFINNFFYDSKSSATEKRLIEYWDEKFNTSDLYINNVFGNPGGQSSQIIISTKMGAVNLKTAVAKYRNPQNPEYVTLNEFNNVYDQNPGFNNYNKDDYSLPNGNKYIDAGAHLTIVQSGCGTRKLTVGDARFFYAEASEFPAWMNVKMDWVAIGSRLFDANKQQISSVDDTKKQLKFISEIKCKDGDKVWLWKDSKGKRVMYGAAPDIGAIESSHNENLSIPPPGNLKKKYK